MDSSPSRSTATAEPRDILDIVFLLPSRADTVVGAVNMVAYSRATRAAPASSTTIALPSAIEELLRTLTPVLRVRLAADFEVNGKR